MEGGIPREEIEKLIFFETAVKAAQAESLKSPKDSDNFTRWGGALLELAHFRQGPESLEMIGEAISKLHEALKIDPKKHEALWCLGNAYTSMGFLISETDKAATFFKQGGNCFQKALTEDPHNEVYKKGLEMSEKAPQLHQELLAQATLQGGGGGMPTTEAGKAAKKKKDDSDFKYDCIGWVVLAIAVVAWVGFAKGAPPPPPPPGGPR